MAFWKRFILEDEAGKSANITDPDGDGVGGLDVYVQDQFTGYIGLLLMNVEGTFTLLSDTVVDTFTFTADPGHGIAIGDCVYFEEDVLFSQFAVLNVVGDVITIDSPMDIVYTTAGTFNRGITNMNVDGSVTPVIFEIGPAAIAALKWDITRMLITIQDGSSMDSSGFGSLVALTRGVVFRVMNGLTRNIFNVKTNGDFAQYAYDIAFDDRAGGGGKFFFRCRKSFGGQSKAGVTRRLVGVDDDKFQCIINDNLIGLDSMLVVVEGHVVE